MEFKEYEQRRDLLTTRFIEQADPLRRKGDVDAWREVRANYSKELQALHSEWLLSNPEVDQKVMS